MPMPVQVTFHGMAHSAALEAAIRERLDGLARFHPQLISCRVVMEQDARRRQQSRPFVVRLDIRVAGAEIVVNRNHSEDPLIAVRHAFDAARRQLEDRAQLQRGE
jgi:ribosome-associated translation inhibitor RaiA